MVVERQEAVHEAERKNTEAARHQVPEPAQEAGQERGGGEAVEEEMRMLHRQVVSTLDVLLQHSRN
jgi:hypothetical protein